MFHVIGVDWGSSNRRAYLVRADGRIAERREDAAGVLATAASDYRSSLMNLIGDWYRRHRAPIWLSGMIGSRDGWKEAPYLPAPARLDELQRHCTRIGAGRYGPAVRILPGICQRPPSGPHDVMRGEETQLLGAWQRSGRDGWYVLPGTHSKWVRIEQGRIVRFHTFMTGELYARLREKGALASIATEARDSRAGFLAGLRGARENLLPAALFGIRAGAVLGAFPPRQAAARLSGALIGAEWEAARALGCLSGGAVFLIGTASIVRWYRTAAAEYGIGAHLLDANDCYRLAMSHCLSRSEP